MSQMEGTLAGIPAETLSGTLSPVQALRGIMGAGGIIVNDYTITVTQITDGYMLTVARGSEVQSATLYGLTDEIISAIAQAVQAASSAQTSAEAAQTAQDAAEGFSRAAAESASNAASSASDANLSRQAADAAAQRAAEHAYGITVAENALIFTDPEQEG